MILRMTELKDTTYNKYPCMTFSIFFRPLAKGQKWPGDKSQACPKSFCNLLFTVMCTLTPVMCTLTLTVDNSDLHVILHGKNMHTQLDVSN